MNIKNKLNKPISVLLSLAIMLPTFSALVGNDGSAEAATSLPFIEQIKTSGDPFTILEIVPDRTQGSIGYYVPGYEPWVRLAGTQKPKENETYQQARIKFVNDTLRSYLNKSSSDQNDPTKNYLLELCNPNGVTASDVYPLSYAGGYTEVYPWESYNDTYHEMPLDHEETATKVIGTFTPQSNGAYIENNKYTLASDGSGQYLQVIEGFSKTTATGDNYYYNVNFTKFTYSDTSTIPNWSLIYRDVKSGETPELTVKIGEVDTGLCVVGVVGSFDFPGLDQGTAYYRASWDIPTQDPEKAPYRAISSSFRVKQGSETGYFNRSTNDFKYVGTRGKYKFSPGVGSTENNITYRSVFFTGGFTNNNWFIKNVFDWETGESKPTIKVLTFTPDAVTEEMVNSANMIVLNYGVNIQGEKYDTIYRNDFGSDLSSKVQEAILRKCILSQEKTPIIYDYNLKDSSKMIIRDLVDRLVSAANTANSVLSKDYDVDKDGVKHITFVSGNQYCINSAMYIKQEDDGTGKKINECYFGLSLASKEFNNSSQIFGDPMQISNSFYPVYEDVYYENFLRDIRAEASGKPVDMLNQDKIAMSTSIRYIINSVKKRVIANKTTVKVLDIEPRSGSLTSSQKSTLAGWLGINTANLTVTTMSASEFVGLTNDPRTDYDLIYLGDSLDGFETKSSTYNGKTVTVPDFTDDTMDGLIYSNVGDTVQSGFGGGNKYGLSGLLERDYSGSTSLNDTNATHTFRYSGNDLTKAAVQKLEDFAKSGYPIIVGDNLIINKLDKSGSVTSGRAYKGGWLFTSTPRCYYNPTTGGSDLNNLLLKVGIQRLILDWFLIFPLYCSGIIRSADCTLYCNGTAVETKNISNSSTVTFDLSGYQSGDQFYCEISVKTASGILGTFSDFTNDPKGRTETFTLSKGGNSDFVDVNSNMYSLLNAICAKKNVKSWSAVSSSDLNKNLLKKFVNLSKPEIVFSKNADTTYVKYPTIYSNQGGVMNKLTQVDGVNRLEYVFKIQNNADPFPQKTRYTCDFYVDMDSNGSFSDDELIYDVGIKEWKNGTSGARVTNGDLVADKEYYVFYELPSTKVGFVPWKLVIKDNVYTAYDAEVNNTRVEALVGEPQPTIEVLQLNSDTGAINLQTQTMENASGSYSSDVTGKRYNGIMGKLFADVSKDFKVNITTISANAANNISTSPLFHTVIDKNGSPVTTQYTDLKKYFESFNMLVLGFDDSYKEVTINTSKVIADYISSNRPVLMTHDLTSFFSLPKSTYWIGNNKNNYVYGSSSTAINGYNVNMLIRSKIGMDRYGVTDAAFGFTSRTPYDITGRSPSRAGSVANAYSGANLSSILDAGYDIAYKPKSLDAIVPETQGLSNGVLARFFLSGRMPFKGAKFSTSDTTDRVGYTSTITQVNKGQITTYPYNVNTALFSGSGTGNTMTIATTHFQYYQLNMNSDDMVVWYCLDDNPSGAYSDSNIYAKNDVTNNYYIYTCGNVTYSGMGHSPTLNEDEAKLFVNTLIAAYRITVVDPTVSFTNKDGTKKGIDSLFVPSDGEILPVTVPTNDIAEESRRIYFTINDSNIIQSKTITAEFPCVDASNKESLFIHDAETNLPVTSLTSTYSYYINLDDVLKLKSVNDALKSSGEFKFIVKVTTTLPSGTPKTGTATITIRKMQLFDLT